MPKYDNEIRKIKRNNMEERFKIACAVHFIIIKDGKILLQRRNNPNKYGYGMLGMPAGHLEANENC